MSKIPGALFPDPPSLWERVQRSMAAQVEFDALRVIYRKARQAERTRADEITRAWAAEAEARRAEQQAARDAEANSDDHDE